MKNKSEEVDLNRISSDLHRWYYSEIRSLADAAIEACCGRLVTELPPEDLADVPTRYRASARESFAPHRIARAIRFGSGGMHVVQYRERGEGVDPREFLTEWVDETADGHEFVIYTLQAKCALLASRNEDAYDDMQGNEGPAGTPEMRACYAMRADVWEMLDARSDEWQIPEIDHGPECPALLDNCHIATRTTWGVRS